MMPLPRYDDTSPETIKKQIVFATIVLVGTVFMLNFFVPNADLILAERIFQASVAATVVVVYWPDAREAWKSQSPERGDYLIVGVTIGWCATFCQAMFSVIFRLAGMPLWFTNIDANSLWILMSAISGILHIVAPGAVDGVVPRRNRIVLGAGIGVAVMGICIVLWSRPDISNYVEASRFVLEDTASWFLGVLDRATKSLRGIFT
ncbi:hypothetical protein [Methylobacterium sp. Leaf85]|uniref:hypothetical protein n=1 Tax=Methylobacterium sp. Leaf85 TaxID=1736241 RepID=UPI0006FEDE81|nr:hypothetical protein [Methylobacterium sp. Leaf85]KQO43042.1 hypothetical protein ASF08_10725 [Methylobacterium sp. Leaf85]